MQNRFTGMKPSCAVLNPMTQMIRLFAAANTQPSQHLLPTRIVEKTVSTQDKQSSRNTSESTSNFISAIFPRMVWLVLRSRPRRLPNLSSCPSPPCRYLLFSVHAYTSAQNPLLRQVRCSNAYDVTLVT